jgi:hypothetical protein
MEPAITVGVDVTFLRMDRPPAAPAPRLPEGLSVRVEPYCTIETYRFLYNTVGADYVWWLRRALSDSQLAGVLRSPALAIHILRDAEGRIGGFYELDSAYWPGVNLNYFGLMPHMVGAGCGLAFLRHAVDTVWSNGAKLMTVNTCTADHPRALPTYIRAGFRPVRELPEVWNVPVSLGLEIPDRLRL